MLSAVSGFPEGFSGIVLDAPGGHDLLCFAKNLGCYDGPFGAFMVKLFFFRNVDLLSGEKIFNLVFMVDQNSAVNRVHKNTAHTAGIPVVAVFGLIAVPIQLLADGAAPKALLVVASKNLADNAGFRRIDRQGEIVNTVISE